MMFKKIKQLLLSVLMATMPLLVHADDTEIYFAGGGGEVGAANILFILDASGSMALAPDGRTLDGGENNPSSRYSIMKNALQQVLGNLQNVNVGYLDYGGNPLYQPEAEKARANGIKYPITPVSSMVSDEILNKIDQIEVGGYTPIVQSIYESTRYFRGLDIDYGLSREPVRMANPAATIAGDHVWLRQFTEGCVQGNEFCSGQQAVANGIESQLTEYSNGGMEFVPSTLSDLRCSNSYGGSCSEWDESGHCTLYQRTDEVIGSWCLYDYQLRTDRQYQSPIVSECQQNYLVLLSDGIPESGCNRTDDNWPGCLAEDSDNSTSIVEKISQLPDFQAACDPLSDTLADGECGEELVDYLASVDQSPELEGMQNVNTFVVGFAVGDEGQQYLEKLARPPAGNQGFYLANDENALAQALTNITLSAVNRSSSFNPPTISIDSVTGLTNSNDVYLPLFEPSRSARWVGNLKRYALDSSGSIPTLADVNGDALLDNNGQILDTARSYWLDDEAEADGSDVGSGGAASLLGVYRNLYVNSENDVLDRLDDQVLTTDWLQPTGVEAEISDEEKARLLQFIRGIDEITEESRQAMGDLLHTRPAVVHYGSEDLGDNATEAEIEAASLDSTVVYVGSNEGYLQALRASDGSEIFGFMPRTLLANVQSLYDNHSPDGDLDVAQHPYGVDGPITVWKNDVNNNGVIEPGEHTELTEDDVEQYYEREFVWLFFGLRRGGNAYYALDVTDPTAPELKWVIRGGEGDYQQLGQSWSKPVVAKLDLDGDKSTLAAPSLIFAGGYDAQQDDKETRSDDDVGNAIYIVDPDTGERQWWASDTNADVTIDEMTNSIPSTITVIDLDNNGVADRMYAADLGGRVFRIDLPDSENTKVDQTALLDNGELTSQGYLLADLSGADSVEDNRRFFYQPDVSVIQADGQYVAAIALGAGYRAHPLLRDEATSQDRLFVLRDADLYAVPTEQPDALLESALIDVTTTLSSDRESGTETTTDVSDSDGGWYLDLDREGGEKALARAVTLDNVVYFTTFTPETSRASNACSFASHTASVYALNVENADPVNRFGELSDLEGELTLEARKTDIPTSDILSEVYLNISQDESGAPVVDALVGANFEHIGRKTFDQYQRVYWFEVLDK